MSKNMYYGPYGYEQADKNEKFYCENDRNEDIINRMSELFDI